MSELVPRSPKFQSELTIVPEGIEEVLVNKTESLIQSKEYEKLDVGDSFIVSDFTMVSVQPILDVTINVFAEVPVTV